MIELPTLLNRESYSTKDIMLILSYLLLAENIAKEDRHKIPNKYIALFAEKDCAYAIARQKTKHPDALLNALIRASFLRNNINQNPKVKNEYKLYLDQLESSIKKADEQLIKQKELSRALDDHLVIWLEKHRVNSNNLTRTGVTMDSSIMTTPIESTFKELNTLLKEFKEIIQSSEIAREGLVNTISSTEAVVPQQMVKEVEAQAANTNPEAYHEQRTLVQGG